MVAMVHEFSPRKNLFPKAGLTVVRWLMVVSIYH